MSMFCYQCQETGRNEGCEFGGVCGKSEDLADLQDLLLYILKGISEVVVKGNLDPEALPEVNRQVIRGLFMTITNANFDEDVFRLKIEELLALRDQLRNSVETSASVENSAAGQSSASVQSPVISFSDAALFRVANERELVYKAAFAGAIPPEDEEDVRSLKHLMLFGLKGLAAYTYHAYKLGKESMSIYSFIYEALAKTLETGLSVGEMLPFVMKTGEVGVEAMALLDQGNTTRFGSPEITKVNIGVGKNPGILISGHDLTDLEQLLEQTQGTGVDIYTHSEMLPAHYYPQLKKYENLVGNYGNAWWQQEEEFVSFRGPVLFTTNCIVPPLYEEVKERIFTTGASGFPGCKHISADANGKKDFRPIIELAKGLQPPTEIEQGTIIGGFAHGQVLALADQVISAVKSGAIKKFVVMAGCDGRMESREYYTEFANALPKDTVILTAGCAKYRYNKLNLGDINGIPRVLDAGQCNDSFSLVMIALKLKEVFQLEDINDLPIAYNISWYEQKAVLVLLALLYLGVKNIHLGPTLPAFLSPNIASFLVENFGIAGITTVDEDLKILI